MIQSKLLFVFPFFVFFLYSSYCPSFWWSSLSKRKRIIQQDHLPLEYCKPFTESLLQDILSLAEARLSHTSSAAVCRKLSSVGRRVLSIESVSNFQGNTVCTCMYLWTDEGLVSSARSLAFDFCPCISADVQQGSWEARWQHTKPRCLLKRLSSDERTKDLSDGPGVNSLSRQQVCNSVWAFSYRHFRVTIFFFFVRI